MLNRFRLSFFLISIILISSVFGIFWLSTYFYRADYTVRVNEEFLVNCSLNSKLFKEKISSLVNYSYEKEAITESEKEIKSNFIIMIVKEEGQKTKRLYANDLLSTNKLIPSDKLDMIRDKIIKQIPRKPYLIKLKRELKTFEANAILPEGQSIFIQNFSSILKKPAIAITYFSDNKTKRITKVFLSDFLNYTIRLYSIKDLFISDFKGNVIISFDTGKLILKENIRGTKIFERSNVSLASLMLKSVSLDDGKYLVASAKMNEFGLILFQTVKEDFFLKGIEMIQRTLLTALAIIFIFAEIFLFIVLKFVFKKKGP